MKRVLVTGVTGYIGSHLARELLPGAEVFGLVRSPLHLTYLADLQARLTLLPCDGSYESVEEALRVSRPDIVYHLAACYTGAHGPRETPELIRSNVTLGACLLEAMAASGCSSLVYAASVMEHCLGEDYRPLNLYAATKRAFSDLVAYYTGAGLIRAAGLVLSDTYGPGDRRPKVLNLIKAAAASGEELALSDGGQDYDVVYIDDAVRAFLLAGTQLSDGGWRHERFQVRATHPLTLRETVELMLRVNGVEWRGGWGQRPPADREMRRAVRCGPAVPGWRPEVPLETGLRRFWTGQT